MTSTMTEILKAWFVFSFSLGCWTCLNLMVSRNGDKRVKKTILVFLLLILMSPLDSYLTLARGQSLHWVTIFHHQITWALGPLMVLLIQHVLLQPISRNQMLFHAPPFMLGLTYDVIGVYWIPFPIFFFVLFAQVFSYLGYAIFLLKKHKNRILNLAISHKNTTYYWLLYLVGSLVFIMMLDFFIYLNIYLGNLEYFIFTAVVGSVVAVYANLIALFSVYQPAVFFHEAAKVDSEEPSISKPVLRSIELSPEAAAQLDEQLQQLIRNHKPHLDEDISLGKLASLLGVTPHQLSELLNIHKSTSFYEFLNDLRIDEALLLINNHDLDLSIADIVYQSGFNNRNSFYKVFKEKTGVTPSQYKKSIG